MINRVELSDRLSHVWKSSRERVGKSQEYMAKSLGVSKKTIQNWENGTSSPGTEKCLEWFEVLGLSPLPYFIEVFYPNLWKTAESDYETERILHILISRMSPASRRGMLYMLCGDHGSSPTCIMEMITAHLQTPLRDRVNVAQSILTNYEIAKNTGCIRNPEQPQPDIEALTDAVKQGKEAVLNGSMSYSPI